MNRKREQNFVFDSNYNRGDESELIYYNLTFINNNSNQVIASATETRTSPILENPSDWLMSVIRFDVDCHAIPINLPKMQPNSNTATTSFITLQYLGNTNTRNIVYVEDSLIVPILTPRPTIYNYQRWLDFVNTAASLAATALGIPGSPPIFQFDPSTQLINMYVDQNYLPAAGPNQVKVFINEELYLYFTNFPYLYKHTNPNNPLLDYQFNIDNVDTYVMPAVGSRQGLPIAVQVIPNLYLFKQLNIGTASWNSVRSIILTSNLLPFKNESIPSNQEVSNNYNSDNIFPILSDFLTGIINEVTLDRVKCEYLPTAQYRYVNLLSNAPLYTIDIKMYYSDFYGNVYPIPLISNAGMSVKILFQKKKLITSTSK